MAFQYDSAITVLDDITAMAKNAWNGIVTSRRPNLTSGCRDRGDGSTPTST